MWKAAVERYVFSAQGVICKFLADRLVMHQDVFLCLYITTSTGSH